MPRYRATATTVIAVTIEFDATDQRAADDFAESEESGDLWLTKLANVDAQDQYESIVIDHVVPQ